MAQEFKLTLKRQSLLAASGHILTLGGPGAGKTTIALLKAQQACSSNLLQKGQKILFLSFARATVSRVAEQSALLVSRDVQRQLEINTYHGFIWKILRSHGYLLRAGTPIKLLAPPQAAARLARISDDAREAEKTRLFEQEGFLHFDLFASLAAELLGRSSALRRLISDAYPIIILDEFQDTNAAEWLLLKTLGSDSTLIALADPDQRIYEFRGADPQRIGQFNALFKPATFDFEDENYRSTEKDIAIFGNDLLKGTNVGRKYKDVATIHYGFYRGRSALFPLKCEVIKRVRSLAKEFPEWSLGILVPTKRLMMQVSDYLGAESDDLPPLHHDVALDAEAPALAATVIAGLLEGGPDLHSIGDRLIGSLCEHIRGRRGNDAPPQGHLDLVDALDGFLHLRTIKGAKRKRIVDGARQIAEARLALVLTGNPEEDWLIVRRLLENSEIAEYEQIADDAKYLRLLGKGAALRARLNEAWRRWGKYRDAAGAVEDALLQEHFSASVRDWRGIHVMTIHKAKGKEFTEVIVFEGLHSGRIARTNTDRDVAQSKLAFRVAVTRARQRTTILTPANDPCAFL